MGQFKTAGLDIGEEEGDAFVREDVITKRVTRSAEPHEDVISKRVTRSAEPYEDVITKRVTRSAEAAVTDARKKREADPKVVGPPEAVVLCVLLNFYCLLTLV